MPCTIWRTSDSPDGMLQSASTHMLPTGSNRPASHLRADAFVERRIVLLHPRVLLRLRRGEAVLGIVVHQPQRVRERARALALRLTDRPQPRGVDVRVADRAHAVRARTGARLASAGASAARVSSTQRTPSIVVDGDRVATRRRARRAPRGACAWSAGSSSSSCGEHEHVEVQGLDVAVHDRELGPTEPVDRRAVDVGHEQRPRRRSPRRDRVRRGLDQEVDRLATRRRPRDHVFAVLQVQSLPGWSPSQTRPSAVKPDHARPRRDRSAPRPRRPANPAGIVGLHPEPRRVPGAAPRAGRPRTARSRAARASATVIGSPCT